MTVLVAAVLAATSWPSRPAGAPAAERRIPAAILTATPTASAPPPSTALLQAEPAAIKRGTPANRHQAGPPARTAAAESVPPGQAKKITSKTGKAKDGHKLRSPGKGGGKGRK
ncbi:hypothetical protein [Nonomuraea sp. KM90]|uniref:hypothetical protein n=1 Tax=Nonomuraea sp. KM90 TaxID=3457428 RepID=UPI003FCE75FF